MFKGRSTAMEQEPTFSIFQKTQNKKRKTSTVSVHVPFGFLGAEGLEDSEIFTPEPDKTLAQFFHSQTHIAFNLEAGGDSLVLLSHECILMFVFLFLWFLLGSSCEL